MAKFLQLGSIGATVKTLQENLIKLGYSCGEDGADGEYGQNTYKAVVQFQKDNDIEVDGVVGTETLKAITKALNKLSENDKKTDNTTADNSQEEKELSPSSSSEEKDNNENILKLNSVGDNVKTLQNMLIELGFSCGTYGADGDFGEGTEAAVKNFQKKNNQTENGQVDEQLLALITKQYQALQQELNKPGVFTPAKLIAIAKQEIGYYEKNTNDSLDDKTANKGSNNWTKYARDLANAGYYNGSKNGYAWCDVFVDWCFYQLTDKNANKAQEIQCQTGPLGAACIYSAQYYRQQNRFSTEPQVGDQIFFGAEGNEQHTGIVESISGNQINTIEGNSADQVARRSYPSTSSYIVGYGHPKYSTITVNPTETSQEEVPEEEDIVEDEPITIQIKVSARVLNVRSKPSFDAPIIATVLKNEVLTLVEVNDDRSWGHLEGSGWICLDYVIGVG